MLIELGFGIEINRQAVSMPAAARKVRAAPFYIKRAAFRPPSVRRDVVLRVVKAVPSKVIPGNRDRTGR